MYVSQPLDTVKVKMQAFPTVYKGMMDCLTQTFKKDGVVRGLYAGTLPSIAANVAENSVLFVGNVKTLTAQSRARKTNNFNHYQFTFFPYAKAMARVRSLSLISRATKTLMNFHR